MLFLSLASHILPAQVMPLSEVNCVVESDPEKSDNAPLSELPVYNSVAFLKVRNTSVSYQSDSR